MQTFLMEVAFKTARVIFNLLYIDNYIVFVKNGNRKKIYYCQFRNPDNATWASGVSTGCTIRVRAEQWALAHLEARKLQSPGDDITLAVFSNSFFDWDGHWSMNTRSTGKRTSERNCKDKTSLLNTHILHVSGSLKLTEIDTQKINYFRNNLLNVEKQSPASF